MSSGPISYPRNLSGAGPGELPHSGRPVVTGTQAAFTQIARTIVGRSSGAEVAQAVVGEVRRLVPSDRSTVWLWQPERETMQLLAVATDVDVLDVPISGSLPVNEGSVRDVLEHGRSIREADLRQNPQEIERQLAASGLRSRLTVPVLVGDTPIGVLAASSREIGVYTLEHQRLLEHLAVHLAVGLEQARLTAEARRHEARLLGLQRVAQRLAGSVAGDDVLDVILDEAVRSVGGDDGILLAWDDDHKVLVSLRVTAAGASPTSCKAAQSGQRAAEQAVQQGQVIVLPAVYTLNGDMTGEAIGAPLIADGRLLGAVTASTRDPHKRFDAADIQVFELYAGQAAAVMMSARQFESERRQRRGAEEVARAAAVIVAEIDQQRRLDLIVERAVSIVGGVAGGLSFLDPQSGLAIVRASYGYPTDLRGRPLPPGLGVTQRVLAERQPVVVDDYAADVLPMTFLRPEEFGATIGVPVSLRGKLLGVLVIQAAAAAPRFHLEDVPLLQAIADLAAVAIDNARTLEREAEHCRQVDAVRSVNAELTRELDLPSLLDLILLRAGEFIGCESLSVLLWDDASQQLIPTACHGLDRVVEWATSARLRPMEGAAGMAAFQRQSIMVEDYRNWPSRIQPLADDGGLTSVMAVPMLYQDRLIGVLVANRLDGDEPFNQQDLELLEVFATQAAVAIENARLFEQATAAGALRELAQLKAELLNTVSHELRTPLSLIHGYAELLLHRADALTPSDVAQMSGEIYASSRTLARLVDDLLDFSQLDRGRLQLRRTTVALNELLDGLVRTFQTQPGGERIRTALEPGLLVDADADRLSQIMSNLLSNALTYAPEGAIVVRGVHLGETIQVDVTDHGPGLTSEEAGRVWETFYRGAEAAHLPNRGSGLGLSVVRQLVELHSGQVGLRSTPGLGATFWFTLPAA